MTDTETPKTKGKPRIHFVLSFSIFLIAVLGFNYYVQTVLFREIESRELKSLESLLGSYAQQVEEQMIGVDTALSALTAIVASDKYTAREKHLLLKQTAESLDIVRVFGQIDLSGQIFNSSRSFPPPDVNVVGRDYVTYFLDGGTDERFLSGPVSNLIDGMWQITMARPVRKPDGTMTGIIAAVIDPGLVLGRVARAALPGDYVTLFDRDVLMVARVPAKDEMIGKSFASAEILKTLQRTGGGYAAATFTNFFTKETRLAAAQRVFDDNLIIVTSRPYDAALAYWNVFSLGSLIVSALLLVFVGAVLWFINLKFRAERSQNDMLRDLNQKVTTQKSEAEKLASIKDDFLANMSHEIRTPMNAITGLSQLLQRTQLSSIQRDYVRQIGLSGKFLLGIIDEILTFSKMEAEQLTVELEPYELDDIIDNVGSIMSVALSEKPIEVVIDVDPSLPKIILGDAQRTQQILVNLASNAIKFTETGWVSLKVEFGMMEDKQRSIRFTVTDTGVGIPQDKLETIFDPFTQADETTIRRFGGTGLGLAITSRLIERMKGTITVESTLGKGSTFTVELPLHTADAEQSERTLPTMRKYHVLLVDDHLPTLKALTSMAQGLNMFVETAQSGREAINKIKACDKQGINFDVLLVDWQMPELDGLQTVKEIKKIIGEKDMPSVVMVTAYQREYLERYGTNETPLEVLTKPVTTSSMLSAVLSAANATDERKTGKQSIPAIANTHSLDGVSILLAEDNLLNQKVAKELLMSAGASVTIAENGVEALSLIEHTHFDIVLMDIHMPVMDGIEATKNIRADPRYDVMPILALTAGVLDSEQKKCIDIGMNGFVGKPFEIEMLVRKIKAVLKASQQQASASENRTEAHAPIDFSKEQIWNRKKALGLAAGREELLRTLVSLFPEMVRANIDAIDHSLDDLDTFAALIHTLQGAAAQIAAERAHAMGKHIEIEAREGSFDTARNLWPQFRDVLGTTALEIERWIQSHSTDSPASPIPSEASSHDESNEYSKVHNLIWMLETGQSDAISRFKETRTMLGRLMSDDKIQEVEHLIHELEFENAARVLREKLARELQS